MNTIYCLGRSYAKHAQELGNEIPASPLIFIKAYACATESSSVIQLPNPEDEFHHELELVLKLGKNLEPSHYTCGIDLTNRSAQNKLKEKGKPWALAKSFKGAAPLGSWQKVESIESLNQMNLQLKINGGTKQSSNTKLLLFKIEQILAYLKNTYPLQPGDLVMTGTPEGVGALHPGDKLEASVGKAEAQWTVSL